MSESAGLTFRDGRGGRAGVLFAGVWLVFLADTFQQAWAIAWGNRHQTAGWIGIAATLAFAVAYLGVFAWVRDQRRRLQGHVPAREAWAALLALGLLTTVMAASVGQSGMSAVVFVAVVGVMSLRPRVAFAFTLGLVLVVEATARTVPGWSEQPSLTFAVCTAAFAMWGVSQLMLRNMELLRAREENAALAVDEERNRFARDLHDILGHSLTVITVKAELANRLLDVDPDRARTELADLERLSRDALVDVRRAVQGYREITLPGELARAREALLAAGIEPDLPNAADEVAGELRDLFAWTVREGVTNVIRHSGARSCRVRLDARSAEVRDDGTGCPEPSGEPGHGSGLAGLRERAAVADAVVVTRTLEPRGFALEVSAR